MSEIAIVVEHLRHSYTKGDSYAVDDISFQVGTGQIFGFLGPSGAGKSTTQNILTGLLPLQEGHAEVDGYDLSKVDKRRFNRIGVSFEQSNVYSKLTALENLQYYAELFDTPTRDPWELLELAGLKDKAKDRAGTFSKGMKHRLTFVRSLLNSPAVWFLDEPTTGLDPAIAATIKDIINTERAGGTTAFLTTHNMHIAEELCDEVGFIIDGQIKLIDSPRNLKRAYGRNQVAVEHVVDGQPVSVDLSPDDPRDRAELCRLLDAGQVVSMHTREATLEEIFISVTGQRLVGDEAAE